MYSPTSRERSLGKATGWPLTFCSVSATSVGWSATHVDDATVIVPVRSAGCASGTGVFGVVTPPAGVVIAVGTVVVVVVVVVDVGSSVVVVLPPWSTPATST